MKTPIALIIAGVTLVGGAAGGVFISYQYNSSIVEEYEGQVAALQATLDDIGAMTTAYTVIGTTKAGEEIREDMLAELTIPMSFLNDSYVLSKDDIVGKYSKISIVPGTPITADTLMVDDINDEKALWNTVREYDVVVNMWPIGLEIGDYVDLRIMMPYGEEYIVLSHMRIDGMSQQTVKFNLTEIQINLYQSALVDYYLNSDQGVMLYFTKYIEPGVQQPANITYKVSEEIMNAIKKNSNLYATAWASCYDAATRADIIQDLIPVEDDEDEPTDSENANDINGGRQQWIGQVTGGESSYTDGSEEEDEEDGGGIKW